MAQGKRQTGTVKWFSGQRGFGFIAPDTGGEDLFVHQTSFRGEGFWMLFEGDAVEFSVQHMEDGQEKAVDVKIPSAAGGSGGGLSGLSQKRSGFGGSKYGRGGGRSWTRSGKIGGDGGGDGGPCYNCGQDGHLARSCPQGFQRESGAGGFGGPCYNCGQDGHLARNCPQGFQRESGAGRFGGPCYNCGQTGHLAKDCSQGGGGGGVVTGGFAGSCYNCGQRGHLARDCSQEGQRFGGFGSSTYSGASRGCYNCGEQGHLARDCPNNNDDS